MMSKKTSKRLQEILNSASDELADNGKEPLNLQIVSPTDVTRALTSAPDSADTEEERDYKYARETMMAMTEQARQAVDLMFRVCEETGHPRSFEVLGQLLKITTEVVKEMVALRKSRAELNKFKLPGDPSLPPSSQPASILDGTTVSIFKGTTTELLKAIRDAETSTTSEE